MRPLYDGFAPPPSYRFVDPPPFFAAGNVEPQPMSTTIALGASGSEPAGVATPDGQFVVSLGRGAIARRTPARRRSRCTSRRSRRARFAPVPNGLRAERQRVPRRHDLRADRYARVTRFAKPGTLLLEIPELGNALFVSPDRQRVDGNPRARAISSSQLSLSAPFAAPGYYLAANESPRARPATRALDHTAVVLGVVVSVAAVALFVGVYLLARKRHRVQ